MFATMTTVKLYIEYIWKLLYKINILYFYINIYKSIWFNSSSKTRQFPVFYKSVFPIAKNCVCEKYFNIFYKNFYYAFSCFWCITL